jgi:hypothetical protein
MSASQNDNGKDVESNPGSQDPPEKKTFLDWVSGLFGRLFGSKKSVNSDTMSPSVQIVKDQFVSSSEPLDTFRRLTGISSSHTYKQNPELHVYRPAPNKGIYKHVVDKEKAAQRKYHFFSRLINCCLAVQIIVAAALTALGAGDGPHAVVTIFGAINTVIAGFLTYLKGSGLPDRPKIFYNEWSKLREYIEQRERDFCRRGCKLDVDKVVEAVEKMYEDIRNSERDQPGNKTPQVGPMSLNKPTKPTGGSEDAGAETSVTKKSNGETEDGGTINETMKDGWTS